MKIPLMVFVSEAKSEIFFVSSYATDCKKGPTEILNI